MESKSLGSRFSLEVLKEISRRWLGPRGPGIVETKIKELSYWSGPKTMGEFLTILDRVEKAAARHLKEGQATVMVSEMFHAVKR